MGLFAPSNETQTYQWVQQLSKALAQNGKLMRAPNTDQWCQEFAQLASQIHPNHLQRVLAHFCTTLKQANHVQAYSAKTFRAKFEQIEAAMLRLASPTLNGKLPIVTPHSNRAAQLLGAAHRWPSTIVPHLPVLVQLSRDRIAGFYARCTRHLATLDEWCPDARFLMRVCELYLVICLAEVEWLPMKFRKYCRRDYYGNPLDLAFDASSQDFRENFWWDWANQWAGYHQVTAFDPLLDTLNQE